MLTKSDEDVLLSDGFTLSAALSSAAPSLGSNEMQKQRLIYQPGNFFFFKLQTVVAREETLNICECQWMLTDDLLPA